MRDIRDVMRRAAAERRFAEAAEVAADAGEKSLAADLHLAAAEALLQEGHPERAREQLERALAFYRSVGATRFIRDADALLALARSGGPEGAPAGGTST